MSYLEELLPEFRKGAKIRNKKWEKGNYYILKNGEVVNQDNEKVIRFFTEAVLTDQWELYHAPEPDWQYIIDHNCLCLFWDDYLYNCILGRLEEISEPAAQFQDYKYKWALNGKYWKNCRPVRRDEVTFYEDKKDD